MSEKPAPKEKQWVTKKQTVLVAVELHYERKKNTSGVEFIHKTATIKSKYDPAIKPLNPHVRGYGVEPHEKDAASVPITLSTVMRGDGFEVSFVDAETRAAMNVAATAATPAAKLPPGPPNPDGSRG